MIDLDKIEADAREATLYQWESGTDEQGALVLAVPRRGEGFTVAEVHSGYEDARHIANMSPANTLELVARLRRAEEKAVMFEVDWCAAKSEFGDAMAKARARIRELEQRIANPQAAGEEGGT